jgi:deazaflavin-dependent oxidoreductase (nitroreductase family)
VKRVIRIILLPVALLGAVVAAGAFAPKWLFYHDRRPTRLGRAVNHGWALIVSTGLTPEVWPGEPRYGTISLETVGRRSGKRRAQVVTWVEHEGERYLVSILGDKSAWVRNAKAAGGRATIHHGRRRPVRLEEVPVEERAPKIRSYLKRTARDTQVHLGVEPDAPIEEFERIAPDHPVFRIVEEAD